MDIQKEKHNYLAMLVAEDAITQEQCSNLSLYNGGNCFHSDFLASSKVDCINWGWSAWLKAKAQAVPQWISVKDGLPPANILVLGMSQTRSNIFNVYNVMDLDEFEEADVTHWMPLPDAPQEPTND